MRRALPALLAALAAGAADAEAPASFVRAQPGPPPGFEDLAGPQVTEVDVYYAGRLLLTTLARYDLTSIEFLEPAAVTAGMERLIDPVAVTAALSGPLPNNASRLCAHPAQTDCGELAPRVAGVIFDESRFRIVLFVNPLQVEARLVHLSRYLPPSSARELASLHRVSLSLAGGGEAGDSVNAAATSFVARGESRLLARYDLGDAGFSLSELSWQRDHAGHEFEAGLFRSFGRSVAFFDERDIVGARIGRSLNTRADLDTAQGTPVFLFLNQRSRVDVLRDGRLLDSRFYEGGNQQLDTARLPDGAYLIELRITGADGRERSETLFFVRSAQLPPRDQPLYFAEAGTIADTVERALPTLPGAAWLRGGAAWRLRDDLGLEVSALHAGGTSLVEGGAFVFGPGWQLQSSLMASAEGDTGIALFARLGLERLSLGLDYRRVSVGEPARDDFDPLPEDFSQGSLTLSAPLASGQLALRARHDRRGRATARGFGVSWSRPVFTRGALSVDMELDAASQDDDRLLRLGLQGRWRNERRFTTVRSGAELRSNALGRRTEALLDARSTWQADSADFGRVTGSAFAVREVERSALGASLGSDSRLGRAMLEAEYVDDSAGSHLAYSANARFGVAAAGRGVAFGGRRGELAAVIVEVGGDRPDARFDVLVDGHSAGEAQAGTRTIIGLRPYATYRVRLRPRGDALLDLDPRPREVTLYPGNVEILRFVPRELTVLVGQALWADGSPVRNARFENVEGYGATDSSGWFQVEVSHAAPLELDTRRHGTCRLTPPAYQAEQGLAVLEPLLCVPIPAPR